MNIDSVPSFVFWTLAPLSPSARPAPHVCNGCVAFSVGGEMRTVCHYQSWLERNLITTANSASLWHNWKGIFFLEKKKAREILFQRSRQITLINQKACPPPNACCARCRFTGLYCCQCPSHSARWDQPHEIACGFRTGAILGLVTYSLFQIMNWIQFVPIYRERIKRYRVSRRINK